MQSELRKQPGVGLYTAHRMARAIPLLTIAELREQPGDGQIEAELRKQLGDEQIEAELRKQPGVLWPDPITGRLAPHRLHRAIRSLRCVAR
jgi:hypothetical protein